jgi:hypothetical protein
LLSSKPKMQNMKTIKIVFEKEQYLLLIFYTYSCILSIAVT